MAENEISYKIRGAIFNVNNMKEGIFRKVNGLKPKPKSAIICEICGI